VSCGLTVRPAEREYTERKSTTSFFKESINHSKKVEKTRKFLDFFLRKFFLCAFYGKIGTKNGHRPNF